MGPSAAWLAQLPAAAAAVADCHLASPDLGQATAPLAMANRSPQGTHGYCQYFTNGNIHWSEDAGAQVTRGAIARYYASLGGIRSRLGFPLTAASPAQRSSFGTDEGLFQRFEAESSYSHGTCERMGLTCGASVYWSERYGAHATWGAIGEYYELQGGTGGPMGFPVHD